MVLPIGSMHDHRPHQPQRVHSQVSFSASDLFSRIVATFLASFSSANRLAVDDRHRGRALLADRATQPSAQGVVNLFPQPAQPPAAEDGVDRFPFGEIERQLPPLAAGTIEVQDRIDHSATIDRWTTTLRRLGQQRSNQLPLFIREITGIIRAHRYGSVLLDVIHQGVQS